MEIRLVVNLEVDLNGVTPENIAENLRAVVALAYAEGMITGYTSAEVDRYDVVVEWG